MYACPKFIAANSPPYEDPAALSALLASPSDPETDLAAQAQLDATHRHLSLFLADVSAQSPVPTLRSFLKLYTSIGAKKLANFLDEDEEEMVQEMMVVKQASRSVSRVAGSDAYGLLDGETITTSDLNFVIDEVRFSLQITSHQVMLTSTCTQNMVQIAESTVGRRYAGWFIKNTERTQKILDDLKHAPLPPVKRGGAKPLPPVEQQKTVKTGQKVAWGGVKA